MLCHDMVEEESVSPTSSNMLAAEVVTCGLGIPIFSSNKLNSESLMFLLAAEVVVCGSL